MMTDERLAEIEARAEKATKGPWRREQDRHGGLACIVKYQWNDVPRWIFEASTENPIANMDFVCHARADIPDLLAEIKRLRAVAGEGGR